jgi:hypothetical protein
MNTDNMSIRKRRSRRKSRELRRNIKLFLIVGVTCFFVAIIISFMIGSLPSFIEKTVSRQIEGEISRSLGKGMDIDDLKKKYKKFAK